MFLINGKYLEKFSNDPYIIHENSTMLDNVIPIKQSSINTYSFDQCKNECDNNEDCSLFMRINERKEFITSNNSYDSNSCLLLDTFDKFNDNNSLAKIGTIYTKPDHIFTTNQLKFIEYKDYDRKKKKNYGLKFYDLNFANIIYPSTTKKSVQDIYNKIKNTTDFKVTDDINELNLKVYSLVGAGFSQMFIPGTIALPKGSYALRFKIKTTMPKDTRYFDIVFGNTTVNLKTLNTNNRYIKILIFTNITDNSNKETDNTNPKKIGINYYPGTELTNIFIYGWKIIRVDDQPSHFKIFDNE